MTEETRETGRWEVGLATALLAGGAGVVTGNPAVFLAATVGLVYAVYGYVTGPPPGTVTVERSLDDDSPLPGAEVTVTLTVTNVGDDPLPDLRVTDRIPEELEVVDDGSAFTATLSPGESATHTYSVRGRRGDHAFDGAVVVTRNLSGGVERRQFVRARTELSCRSAPEGLPLAERTIPHTGRIETDDGGEGVEFYATRSYQRGDPMGRIDWNRYARTGELTTIQYREEQAAVVVVVVDARMEASVARDPVEPDAVELGAYAAEEVVDTLLERHNRVGLAMYGGHGGYLSPAAGDPQRLRVRQLLQDGPGALGDGQGDRMAFGGRRFSALDRRIPPEAQVVLVSPLLDDDPVGLVNRFRAHGHPVTVVSPDVTAGETPGDTLARIDRAHRVHELRESETRVLEWSPDEPLHTAVARAERRWSG
ncbi:DUF58 domain-containing protein [Halobacteriales archaeon QS_8_69_26]|nr:MAG: DUF58 domain-containing protein [Halobacteriales archaeon QS_8_69_26]